MKKTAATKFLFAISCFFIPIASFCIFSVSVQAEEQPREYTQGILLPEYYAGFQNVVQQEVDRKNAAELFNQNIQHVSYNNDGTIQAVTYEDGSVVRYSYEYDTSGKLSSCTLDSGDVKITLTNSQDTTNNNLSGTPSSNGNGHAEESAAETGGQPADRYSQSSRYGQRRPFSPDTGIITVYAKTKGTLDEIARNPARIDFKEVKDAIKKVSMARQDAYREYLKATNPYYKKIETELQIKLGSLRAEGIDLGMFIEELSRENTSEERRRGLVDDAMAYLYKQMRLGDGDRPVAQELLNIERSYRMEFLELNKAVYDSRVKKSLEYLHGVIDKIINSKLLLYLNIQKEEIEAIVNLPENQE